MYWLALLLILVLLAGCGSRLVPAGPLLPQLTASSGQLAPPAGDPDGSLRLWQDAAIFQPVGRLLTARGRRLWVEMYEFERLDLAADLLSARDRGLDVRLIVDPTVAVSRLTAERLRQAGLAVRFYPVDDRAHQIDHVKLVLTDDTLLVGGMNWGNRSYLNHDYAIESRSPPILERVGAIFEQDWALAGGDPPLEPESSVTGPAVETTPGREIKEALLAAARSARRGISAELFVLTDQDAIWQLVAAHRRGVRVRVLLDPNQDVSQPAYALLRQAGVEARWFPIPEGAKLHAKAGLFDGRLLLGSANWSLSGLTVNHELDLVTDDSAVAAAFASRFEADWRASPP